MFCLTQSEAFYQSRDSNYNISIASGGGSTTTWNPANTDTTDITLSNGNLTATIPSNNPGASGTIAVRGATSGKKYWEVHNGFQNNAGHWSIGIADSTYVNTTRLSDTSGGVGMNGSGTIVAGGTVTGNRDSQWHGRCRSDCRRPWSQSHLVRRERWDLEQQCFEQPRYWRWGSEHNWG
jgi:hypothetical protein